MSLHLSSIIKINRKLFTIKKYLKKIHAFPKIKLLYEWYYCKIDVYVIKKKFRQIIKYPIWILQFEKYSLFYQSHYTE